MAKYMLAAALLTGALATGCGGGADEPAIAAPSPSSVASPSPSCTGTPSFQAGELPAGWDPALKPGPGGGGAGPAIGHWAGEQGQYVEVVDGQGLAPLTAPTQQLVVLGSPATSGGIHEGFGVQFQACGAPYALNGFGLSAAALNVLAESLTTM